MIKTLSIGNLLIGSYQSGFLIDKHSGFGMPSLRVDMKDRGHYQGANFGYAYYGKRALIIDGEIIGLTVADYEEKRRLMAQELDATKGLQTLYIETQGGLTVTVDVILGQAIDLPYEKGKMVRGKFQLSLIAEKPYFEGLTINEEDVAIYEGGGFAIPFALPLYLSFGETTSAIITNDGNGYIKPVFTVWGGCTNPSITNNSTDETLSIVHVLAPGDYVEIDCYNRTAMLNGSTNITDDISGDWFSIKPGANEIIFNATSPDEDAKVSFSFKDTYIGL